MPWIVNLHYTLPIRQSLAQWNLTWVGIDLITLLVIIAVVYLALKRGAWLSLALVALATINLADGWFDILTSSGGQDTTHAIMLAVLVEIPWAMVSIWGAVTIHRQMIASVK